MFVCGNSALPTGAYCDDRDAMKTPEEYRQHAADCLKLADESGEAYAKAALMELAAEFRKAADAVKQRMLVRDRAMPAGASRRHALTYSSGR